MQELKSIFVLLLLLVGGFVLYMVLPAYWGDFKLGRLIAEQSLIYTYKTTSPQEIATVISEKARAFNVPLSPEQVSVQRGGGDLTITADYTVHVDLPIYPLDLNFKTTTNNKDVMKK